MEGKEVIEVLKEKYPHGHPKFTDITLDEIASTGKKKNNETWNEWRNSDTRKLSKISQPQPW